MATLRNKRKLAALNKENFEEHPRSNLAQNSNAPDQKKTLSLKFLGKLWIELQESCPRSAVGLKTAFWARHPV